MTVKALIKLLQAEDPNATVILSSDMEGNSYSLFGGPIHPCAYREDDGDITLGIAKLTAAAKRVGYGPDDVLEDGKPAVVLYP